MGINQSGGCAFASQVVKSEASVWHNEGKDAAVSQHRCGFSQPADQIRHMLDEVRGNEIVRLNRTQEIDQTLVAPNEIYRHDPVGVDNWIVAVLLDELFG